MRLLPPNHEDGWTPYAWLIYLGLFIVSPIATGAGALEWVALALGTMVFLALYFRAYWYRGRRVLGFVLAIALLGAAYLPFNVGASVFFIYAAAFIGTATRPRSGVKVLLALVAFVLAEAYVLGLPLRAWLPVVVFSLLIGGVNIHFGEERRRNARLRLAQEEVQQTATAAERERIARDLHDLLGHSLSVITLKSELASKLLGRDLERAKREIEEIERISRGAMAEVRRVVRGYCSRQLGVELAGARMALASADIDLEVHSSPFDLSPVQESVLALALREAITNVVRHSRASCCRVELRQDRRQFRLTVRDDGRGGDGPAGSGLSGMVERVEALGGRVERDGTHGTTLTVTMPLDTPRERPDAIEGRSAV